MAYGDYISCCKCGCKLIYDGDRGQRGWWEERWNVEPQIECPDCKKPPTWEDLLGAVARGWTHETTEHKTMDPDLAVAIAKEVQKLYKGE